MTHALSSLLSSLAWTASAVLCIYRADRIAHRWLAMKEQRTAVPEPVEIPDDLVGLALAESEKWAQDAIVKVVRERWDQYKDWNKVRAAMGVAARD